jgi:hypothetical protein
MAIVFSATGLTGGVSQVRGLGGRYASSTTRGASSGEGTPPPGCDLVLRRHCRWRDGPGAEQVGEDSEVHFILRSVVDRRALQRACQAPFLLNPPPQQKCAVLSLSMTHLA